MIATDKEKIIQLDEDIKNYESIKNFIVHLLEEITNKDKQILDLKSDNKKLLQTIGLVRDIVREKNE